MLNSSNIHHTIKSFNNVTKRNGYINSILELKRRLHYDYIQDSVFPYQGAPKVYLFKMYTHWLASVVDIVMLMQLGGDFEMHGSCLIMSNVFKVGLPWVVMFMT
jgi:hypothetical protein